MIYTEHDGPHYLRIIMKKHCLLAFVLVLPCLSACQEQSAKPAAASAGNHSSFDTTFVNPIYEGSDPFVYKHTDGFYYFCQSEGDRGIAVWKSDKLTDKGVKRTVWRRGAYPSAPSLIVRLNRFGHVLVE